MKKRSHPLRVLVTNDDGIRAEGLNALVASLQSVAETFVVAPAQEQSGTSSSLTLIEPLRANEIKENWVSVEGTPTDCVILASNELLPHRPDLILSGINHGPNMGEDIFYSGTVAAAIEGTIIGVPSVAVSVAGKSDLRFDAACRFTMDLIEAIDNFGLPTGTLLNVNVPNLQLESISGYLVTKLGNRSYSEIITKKQDPRGRTYYWIGGKGPQWTGDEETDFSAVSRGLISLTPLHLDMTDYQEMSTLRSWKISSIFPKRA